MGEVADLGAGALQDFAVGVEEQVQLLRQRSDVARIIARDPLGLAAPDRRQGRCAAWRAGCRPKRICSSVVAAERDAEKAEGDGKRDDEAADVVVDLVGRAGDADDEAAVLAEIDVALDDAQRAVVRTLAVARADLAEAAVVAGRHEAGSSAPKRECEERSSAGARRAGRPASTSPTAGDRSAGRRASRARAGPGRRRRRGRRRGRSRRRGGAVEGALGRVAVEGREDQPRDEQDQQAPEQRRGREADRDRAAGEDSRRQACGSRPLGGLDQVAEPAHRLDQVDAELLAQAPDEHLDGVRSRGRNPGRRGARSARLRETIRPVWCMR